MELELGFVFHERHETTLGMTPPPFVPVVERIYGDQLPADSQTCQCASPSKRLPTQKQLPGYQRELPKTTSKVQTWFS